MTTKPLTADELARIRERAEKAEAGPWIFDDFCYVWRGDDLSRLDGGMISDADEEETWIQRMRGVGREVGFEALKANGQFIAHSREDVPRLLVDLDHYREREDRLIALIAELRDPKGNGRIGAAYAANRIDEILGQNEKVSSK